MDGILHVVRPFHSHTGKLNMDKKAVHPKLIDSFNSIPIKIMGDIFAEVYKLIPKFIWNCKECSRQSNFEKEMCEMFKVVYFILKICFHYCIIYIYANKISPNILEHGFFFTFCYLLYLNALKVSLRKKVVAIYFRSSSLLQPGF